ncbi:MAG: sigma-70 RNA polymerase sigma factor region 4 domain-containing protein [Phycisphaerales bacterium]
MGIQNLIYASLHTKWVRNQAKKAARGTNHSDTEEIHSSCVGRLADARDAQSTEEFRGLSSAIVRNARNTQFRRSQSAARRERVHAQILPDREPSSGETTYVLGRVMDLPAELREVLILTARGHTSDCIAQLQGVSPSTVRDRRQRALGFIREACDTHD